MEQDTLKIMEKKQINIMQHEVVLMNIIARRIMNTIYQFYFENGSDTVIQDIKRNDEEMISKTQISSIRTICCLSASLFLYHNFQNEYKISLPQLSTIESEV